MLPHILTNISNQTNTPLVISLVGAGGKTSTAFWLAKAYKKLGHHVLITTTTKMYLPPMHSVDYFISLDKFNIHQINTIAPSRSHFDKTNSSVNTQNNRLQGSISFLYQNIIQQIESKTNKAEMQQVKTKVQGITPNEVEQLKKHSPFTIMIIEADGAKCLPIKCPANHEPNMPACSDVVICVSSAETIFKPINSAQINRWHDFSALTRSDSGQILNKAVLSRLLSHSDGSFKRAPKSSFKIWLINKIDLNNTPSKLKKMATEIHKNINNIDEIWLTNMREPNPIKTRIK